MQSLPQTSSFQVGDLVQNLGFTAKVVGFHEITGDLLLKDPAHMRRGGWIAPAKNCRKL